MYIMNKKIDDNWSNKIRLLPKLYIRNVLMHEGGVLPHQYDTFRATNKRKRHDDVLKKSGHLQCACADISNDDILKTHS